MSLCRLPSKPLGRQILRTRRSFSLPVGVILLMPLFDGSARPQEPPPQQAQSIVEAARLAREHKSRAVSQPKVITDDDLQQMSPLLRSAASPAESLPKNETAAPAPQAETCNNAEVERLKSELQSAEEQLDQVRQDLSYQPEVISNGDLDSSNFKPGSSGFKFDSQPLAQTQPLPPARVTEVTLNEKIASLKAALQIACDPPEAAGLQKELDAVEKELSWLQRQVALDQDTYYSQTGYAADAAGKARLDAEQERIQFLESEKERLSKELAATRANPTAQ
jgi:hypothetical protein